MSEEPKNLKPFLENLLQEINLAERRDADPVDLVWRAPADQREVAALLVSALAYGQVAVLKKAALRVLEAVDWKPRDFALQSTPDERSALFSDFVYRMTRGPDVADFFAGVGGVLREYGSLEAAYQQMHVEEGAREGHLIRASKLVRLIRSHRDRDQMARGFQYLLPDPALGSTTKRLHLFFRWMVRGPDAIDLGLWASVDPAVLVMPLDTHTSRICRYLGLTARKSQDVKAAIEVSESLAEFDESDPLRYDFAICHLGISKECIHKRSDEHCPFCPIEPVCALQ